MIPVECCLESWRTHYFITPQECVTEDWNGWQILQWFNCRITKHIQQLIFAVFISSGEDTCMGYIHKLWETVHHWAFKDKTSWVTTSHCMLSFPISLEEPVGSEIPAFCALQHTTSQRQKPFIRAWKRYQWWCDFSW